MPITARVVAATSANLGPLELCEQSGFLHAVYVSWPHDISSRGREIVTKLASSLEDSFRGFPGMPRPRVYLDEQRLQPGDGWDKELRHRLARSAVTLVLLVPTYFGSEYCRIEWGITADLETRRIPPGEQKRRTCRVNLALVRKEELNAPLEVEAIQFSERFEKLRVWGRRVDTHPSWRKLVEDLRVLIFERISLVCTTSRNWPEEERIAMDRKPHEFKWKPLPSAPAFPIMKSVEGS
ncbi:MAG TPA: toll/interleukin-1 receptor domain-containing protein [Polyangiaceae bacterium]|nr:toll/interleukin-1 receptor domain-containing protein [Polyangiaceae bacterium]